MIHYVTLQQYLEKRREQKTKSESFSGPIFCTKFMDKTQYDCIVVKYGNLKASVFYYLSLDLPKYELNYHFAILLPYSYYKTDILKYSELDYKTTFEQYITEYVQTELCFLLERPRPKFREAVIFDHI